MNLEMTIDVYFAVSSFTVVALFSKISFVFPPVKDTWSKIPDIIESLTEITRAHNERHKALLACGLVIIPLTLNELAWSYFRQASDWAPVIDAVTESFHIVR